MMNVVGKQPDRSVVIAGGGIAGLSAALELREAGFEVVVLERREMLAEVNAGFLLWSFAIKRLNALGLGGDLAGIGRPMERLLTRSWRGQVLSDVSLRDLNARVGAPSYDVHRAGLQQLLADAVGTERIRLGAQCVRVSQTDKRATAHLQDGEAVHGDLLVGADGVHSVVRETVAGKVALRSGAGVWRGVARVGTDLIPDGVHLRVMGPGGVFGAGRLDDIAVRWYAGGTMTERPPETAEERKSQAQARFGGWLEPTSVILDETDPKEVLFNETRYAHPFRPWAAGRLVLIGDAAHPMLPSFAIGGGTAIEDAATLRQHLGRASDVNAGLRAFEQSRRPQTGRIQWAAAIFARVLAIRNARLARLRDAAFSPPFNRLEHHALGHLMKG